jgi:hypothetical protein
MEDKFYISKDRTLADSVNYSILKEEGLKYIESLTSAMWTDYNEHDPGITILETALYAMTELGYRAGFDIKDLLTNSDGTIVNTDPSKRNDTFFTAREILTNRPLNVEDYRKLLIDIVGVHNAWIFPEKSVTVDADESAPIIPKSEINIYADCKKDMLTYTQGENEKIELKGLTNVLLELENTIEFGDLNVGNIHYVFTEGDIRGITLEAYLPYWKLADIEMSEIIKTGQFKIHSVVFKELHSKFEITLLHGAGFTNSFKFDFGYTLKSKVANNLTKLIVQLNQKITYINLFTSYIQKVLFAKSIISRVNIALQENRNLTEDFVEIDTVKSTEIAICADIDVAPSYDIEKILAEVYYRVNLYFSPSIHFYLLKELISKGITIDNIFEGPKLKHGFIDTDELKLAQLRSEIRVSDLINEIMDIEGVRSIKNILLTAYNEDGTAILPSQKWCIHLSKSYKPQLNVYKSKILFFKDQIPFSPNLQETYDTYSYMLGTKERPKLIGQQNDLAVPNGVYYDFSSYTTIQYELPQTYGVSPFGLPTTASATRKSQAMQLRAYLMFYDQLLADFFAQLDNAKKLLSIDNTIDRTYFSNYISDVLDIEMIYNANDIKSVLAAPTNDSTNIAIKHQDLVEDKLTYNKRRNNFIDHLMARFSETFNDYVLMMYDLNGSKINNNEVLKDKINFLRDYPETSSERGRAFNYTEPCWVLPNLSHEEKNKRSHNVSGLEKRIARLTGIDNFSRRNLFCLPDIKITKNGKIYSFELIDSKLWLKSLEDSNLDSEEKIDGIINSVYENFLNKLQYSIEKKTATQFFVFLLDSSHCKIAIAPASFPTEKAAQTFILSLISHFKVHCDSEGLHLIEHILLRPRFKAPVHEYKPAEEIYKLMSVCLDEECSFCGEQDPYSFKVSILLPYWNERFSNLNFRKYFEKLIQTETPAHIAVKICWISFTAMKKFEVIFRKWNAALSDYKTELQPSEANKLKFMKINNELIEFLGNVKSKYPKAHLHDCEEGTVNPVRLGQTTLGSY